MSLLLNCSAKIFCAAVLASTLGICAAIPRAYAMTEREAQDIAVEAYVYFCPPVTMDVTCKQLTNLEPGKLLSRSPEVLQQLSEPEVFGCHTSLAARLLSRQRQNPGRGITGQSID